MVAVRFQISLWENRNLKQITATLITNGLLSVNIEKKSHKEMIRYLILLNEWCLSNRFRSFSSIFDFYSWIGIQFEFCLFLFHFIVFRLKWQKKILLCWLTSYQPAKQANVKKVSFFLLLLMSLFDFESFVFVFVLVYVLAYDDPNRFLVFYMFPLCYL